MYAAGFEDSMKILTASMSKEKKLDAAVKEFEVCAKLKQMIMATVLPFYCSEKLDQVLV